MNMIQLNRKTLLEHIWMLLESERLLVDDMAVSIPMWLSTSAKAKGMLVASSQLLHILNLINSDIVILITHLLMQSIIYHLS